MKILKNNIWKNIIFKIVCIFLKNFNNYDLQILKIISIDLINC